MYTINPTSLYSMSTRQSLSQEHTTERIAGTIVSSIDDHQDNLLLDTNFLLYCMW